MKKFIRKSLIVFFLLNLNTNILADIPHYLDFKYILNESDAGKKAQQNHPLVFLKNLKHC